MTKRYSSDPKQRAAELVAEGKIGGKRKGAGRPRKVTSDGQRKRASTVIAEYARENAEEMAKVITDCLLDPDATQAEKMRAVKLAVGIDSKESDRERDELADPNSSLSQEIAESADEARANLARKLSDPVTGQRLRDALAGVLAEAGSTPSIAA
jgi:hypothetical protein